jgi:formylglycine-generating enzyme required for sulfatase activity
MPFTQDLEGSLVEIRMVALGDVWIARTETTWDVYDLFVDAPAPPGAPADAVTRPTRPYVPPDRGFGHSGYPAIGVSHHAALEFCRWLSERTGRTYRLPTEEEWLAAWSVAARMHECAGRDAAAYEWHADRADGRTHPVASLAPSDAPLHDMMGNVAEWVIAADGTGVLMGGSFLDGPDALANPPRRAFDRAWNASDPQIPRSRWWLADAPFAGFRVVCQPRTDDERGMP